jgi:hypothetical protein
MYVEKKRLKKSKIKHYGNEANVDATKNHIYNKPYIRLLLVSCYDICQQEIFELLKTSDK